MRTGCTGRRRRPRRAAVGVAGGEDDGATRGDRDPGGDQFALHAAGADGTARPRPWPRSRCDRLDQRAGARASGRYAGRPYRARRRRTAAPARRPRHDWPPAPTGGRCRRSGSRSAATVSFSFTTGTTPSSSSVHDRGAGVEIAAPLLGVVEREQDLRGLEPVPGQALLPGAGEHDLAGGGGGLLLLEPQGTPAAGPGARGRAQWRRR